MAASDVAPLSLSLFSLENNNNNNNNKCVFFQTQTFLNGGDCIDAIITLLIDLSITYIASS
jgi:hypothetical protein